MTTKSNLFAIDIDAALRAITEANAGLVRRHGDLMDSVGRFPPQIEDAATLRKAKDFAALLDKHRAAWRQARLDDTKPFRAALRRIEAFFKDFEDETRDALKIVLGALTQAAQQSQFAQARDWPGEGHRIDPAGAPVVTLAGTGEPIGTTQPGATVPGAAIATRWEVETLDRSTVDLEALRPFLSDHALIAAARHFLETHGPAPLRGVSFVRVATLADPARSRPAPPLQKSSQPPVVKSVVLLANSRKMQGRCLAGKLIGGDQPGGWIRPVGSGVAGAVLPDERQPTAGSEPALLDVLDFSLGERCGDNAHPEDWRLAPGFRPQRRDRMGWAALSAMLDPPGGLWVNGYHSTNGANDKIPVTKSDDLPGSLRLIRTHALKMVVYDANLADGDTKRHVRGMFKLASVTYALRVTDVAYEDEYLRRPNASYDIGECCLTISVGEPFNGFRYKLIAAIIERARTP